MFKYQLILFLIIYYLIFNSNCFNLIENQIISSTTISNNFINISFEGQNMTLFLKTEEPQKNKYNENNNNNYDNESSESIEFLETLNGDKLVKGDKVIEVKTEWSTHLGDDDAEAT